jgi:hypothetical protein
MQGLSLEVRYKLLQEAQKIVLERMKFPGTRQLVLTTADLAVFRTLLFDFHNSRSGRCNPGMRAIARRARVALGTVSSSARRLVAAGFMRLLRPSVGLLEAYTLQPTFQYDIFMSPIPCSEFARNPLKKERVQRTVAQQLRALAAWGRDWESKRAANEVKNI